MAGHLRQVGEAEPGGPRGSCSAPGDVSAGRDFTDVRDVVRAYVLAAEAEAGAYNVCGGRSTTVVDLIGLVRAEARPPVRRRSTLPAFAHEPREMRSS